MDESGVVVEAEITAQKKAFYRLDVDESISEQAPHIQGIILVESEFAKRILTVGHAAYRTGIGFSVGLENWHDRRHLQSIFHWMAVDLLRMGQREVLSDGNNPAYIERRVDSGGDILEIGIFENTVVPFIPKREEYVRAISGRRNRSIVALGEACA